MHAGDAIDDLLVFRPPGTQEETATAWGLLGDDLDDKAEDGAIRAYVLVDIERPGEPAVVAAVAVCAMSGLWRVLKVGGDERHKLRLVAEVVRVASAAGASRLTVGPTATSAAWQLMSTTRRAITDADASFSFDL